MSKPEFAYDDPRPRCVPTPPFWKACNLAIDCGEPECPRHAALRAAAQEKKQARAAARQAAKKEKKRA